MLPKKYCAIAKKFLQNTLLLHKPRGNIIGHVRALDASSLVYFLHKQITERKEKHTEKRGKFQRTKLE